MATQAVPREITSYRDIAKQVLPAVVSIETKAKATVKKPAARRPLLPDNPGIPEELRKFLEEYPQPFEMPDPYPRRGFGSGFIVDPKGVVLTNYHVVAGATEVEVQLQDGRKFTSKDFKGDPKTDLAIVRIDSKTPLPNLEFGDSDGMEIGDRVLAFGTPFGLTGTVTAGIVSAKGRNLRMNMYEDFIQTDAAVNPGNSGGPLVNLEGKVIGINSAIKSQNGGFQGVSMSIASNLARNIMEQLLKDGKVRRGYLGVQIQNLDPEVAVRLGVTDKVGVLVAKVMDGTPAAKAGMKEGDVVTIIGGKAIKDGRELQQRVAELPAGKPVDVVIVRDGKSETLKVTVEEQPQEFGATTAAPAPPSRPEDEPINLDKIGIRITDLTSEWAERLGYKDEPAGVLITQVDPNGLAADKGLRTGMVLQKVDGKAVKSAASAVKRSRKATWKKASSSRSRRPRG